jgi:hypothetical protein
MVAEIMNEGSASHSATLSSLETKLLFGLSLPSTTAALNYRRFAQTGCLFDPNGRVTLYARSHGATKCYHPHWGLLQNDTLSSSVWDLVRVSRFFRVDKRCQSLETYEMSHCQCWVR